MHSTVAALVTLLVAVGGVSGQALNCADHLLSRGLSCTAGRGPITCSVDGSRGDKCGQEYCCNQPVQCVDWIAFYKRVCYNNAAPRAQACVEGGSGNNACGAGFCCPSVTCLDWIVREGQNCPYGIGQSTCNPFSEGFDKCSTSYCCGKPPAPPTSTITITVSITATNSVTLTVPSTAPQVVYKKTSCSGAKVKCPAGTSYILDNKGYSRSCLHTFVNGALVSTTCTAAYCCGQVNVKPTWTWKNTRCKDAGVKCPAGSTYFVDPSGLTAPCTETYYGQDFVSTTCQVSTCCYAVTVKPPPSGLVPCNKHVKCSAYKKDKKTGGIRFCQLDKKKPKLCSTAYCCLKV